MFKLQTVDSRGVCLFDIIISKMRNIKLNKKPTVIIFNTIKGKGIKEFENDPIWHARQLKKEDIAIGKKRLNI